MARLILLLSGLLLSHAFVPTGEYYVSLRSHLLRIFNDNILTSGPTQNKLSRRRHRSASTENPLKIQSRLLNLFAKKPKNSDRLDNEDGEEDEVNLSDHDWRDFRAKLVMSSKNDECSIDSDPNDLDGIGSISSFPCAEDKPSDIESDLSVSNFTPLDPSQWAYDSGTVIEKGAVILGGVEQKFGFALRQQYFHKAAILVLDHDETKFTKGILLNRPSNIMLKDDMNKNVKWRVWFGGDVQGLDSPIPEIVCLHSLKGNEEVEKASFPIMKGIKWTSFEDAKKLVFIGAASPDDFWVFAGYAGWSPNQLMGELERKSWYMCATDSQTLLVELAKQSTNADPRDAGIDIWELLMNMIGRGETADECSGDFDDLMLKEWARDKLISVEASQGGGIRRKPSNTNNLARDLNVGTLLRASSKGRSPFLLTRQEFHKATILIISEDQAYSVGVLLNHPSPQTVDLEIVDKKSGHPKSISIPIRYGGEYHIKGEPPNLWLHTSAALRRAQVGRSVGQADSIWRCTQDEAISAIEEGIASADDFMVASGFSIWEKGVTSGISSEVHSGNFEVIPTEQISRVWDKLQLQVTLTNTSLLKNLRMVNEAWTAGDAMCASLKFVGREKNGLTGDAEGYDEDNDSLVFKSDERVSRLSDDALRSWVATFLLGAPSLGA